MKKLHCSDLGGSDACTEEITGETFEEMGNNCKAHVMTMLQSGDVPHMTAIAHMQGLSPEEQHKEFAEYQKKFEEAEEVK